MLSSQLQKKPKNLAFDKEKLNLLKGKGAVTLGGGSIKSHAKRKRPLAPRATYHVVLRSEKAKGRYNMLKNEHKKRIESIVHAQAKRFFVRIEGYANVGNHLHIKAFAQGVKEFQNFLRTVSALIARNVTGAKKGVKFGRFWDGLIFTRILKSLKEHEILNRYIFANILESSFGYEARQGYLEAWYQVPGWRDRLRPIIVGSKL